MRAYNELVSRILHDEDRAKFEWSVGAMLTGAIPRDTVIEGPARSGKTTLTSIVRSILTQYRSDFSPRVSFIESIDGAFDDTFIANDTYIFVECLRASSVREGSLIVRTTGDSIPVNTYHVLMEQIRDDLYSIADHCIHIHLDGPETIIENTQENI